jgi:nitrate reductase gamma subunit
VLTSVRIQIRRHRHKLLWVAAVFAAAAIALSAKSALASAHVHGEVSDAVAICFTVGACVAVAGVAAFAVRRLGQRPLWQVSEPLGPVAAFVPAFPGFLVRAGPPPPLLQVFRF